MSSSNASLTPAEHLARALCTACVVVLASGCPDKSARPSPMDAATSSLPSASVVPAPLPLASSVDASLAEGGVGASTRPLEGLEGDCNDEAAPRSGKSVGHTSLVFKLELEGGRKVAYKPNAKRVRNRWRGEVAAYRLGKALGIPNIPVACYRAFAPEAVAGALEKNADAAKLFTDQALVERGRVDGVVIPWIEGLRFWPLENEGIRAEVHRWLKANATIPDGKADLARQASLLVAFDFLTSNWDRYSGGNVGLDATGATVLFIDNDAAFTDGPPKTELARNRNFLDGVDRFSRSFIDKVRALPREDLDANQPGKLAAIFGEAGGKPLLPEAVIAGFAKRRLDLLTVVDAKTKERGESETLYFP